MVSFSCERCNDTVKKPKADQHAQRCKDSLTCIDCSKTFSNGAWKDHNSCISEAEAYQGALYKPTKKEMKRKAAELQAEQAKATKLVPESPASAVVASAEEIVADLNDKAERKSKKAKSEKTAAEKTAESKPDTQPQIDLLKSVIGTGQKVSIHKALKLLKAQNMLDKDAEKKLLKEVSLSLTDRGEIVLTQHV